MKKVKVIKDIPGFPATNNYNINGKGDLLGDDFSYTRDQVDYMINVGWLEYEIKPLEDKIGKNSFKKARKFYLEAFEKEIDVQDQNPYINYDMDRIRQALEAVQ